MMGLLLYLGRSPRIFSCQPLWTLEMAQFSMAAYYILGGALFHAARLAHVRMDLALWPLVVEKARAFSDTITSMCLIFYLVMLLYGGFSSTEIRPAATARRSFSSWAPPMAPDQDRHDRFGIGLDGPAGRRDLLQGPGPGHRPRPRRRCRARGDPGMSYEMIATADVLLHAGHAAHRPAGVRRHRLRRGGRRACGSGATAAPRWPSPPAMKLMKWYPLLTLPPVHLHGIHDVGIRHRGRPLPHVPRLVRGP